MTEKDRLVLALAFAASFLAVGLPYWQIPYAQVSLPNAIWGLPLIAVGGFAAVARAVSASRLWPTTLIIGAAVPAAVMARVVYDAMADPTSHNLWPFELVLAAGPGLLAAFIGALSGGLFASRERG